MEERPGLSYCCPLPSWVVSSLPHLLHCPLGNVHSQVMVTGAEMEDQGHHVPDLTENPEPMEEEAEAAGPPPVLGDTSAQIPPPPPPERELDLERPAMADPGQELLLDPQAAPLTKTNPEPPFLAP
ncbi:hypothetical protein H1C71_023110, partial [Ictidomys tridecemlineatus]